MNSNPSRQEGADSSHLDSRHRDTLAQIFRHPVSHNVQWQAVLSLLEAIATVEKGHDGRFVVTLGGETQTLDPPRHKDVDAQQLVDLRRMMKDAGYGTGDRG